MTRLLYGGCTTFKPLSRRLYLVSRGVKNWELLFGPSSLKHLKNRISDCRVRLCSSLSMSAIARQKVIGSGIT